MRKALLGTSSSLGMVFRELIGYVSGKWVGTQQVHVFRGYSGSGESLRVCSSCAQGRAPAGRRLSVNACC